MPHINTKPGQHDPTVTMFVLRLDTTEPSMLLHLHKKLGGYYPFGGHIELDETPWDSVRHELLEESGYEMDQLDLLQPKLRLKNLPHGQPMPYPVCVWTAKYGQEDHYHDDLTFAFVTKQKPRQLIAKGESQDLKLFTRAELLKAPNLALNALEISLFIFDECLTGWDRLPAKDF